ncbi:MAG: XdhC family protein [Oscillospiraceae bacterium]|nr:XdhC family protein [Oscillospiraceae bacterium]
MKNIMEALLREREEGRGTVLATVIGQSGSVPRGCGAQMLVGASGRLAGTVGGGAIEARAIRRGMELLAQGVSATEDFSLCAGQGDLGMVCGGEVTVRFVYVGTEDGCWRAVAEETLRCFWEKRRGYLVQALRGEGAAILDEEGNLLAGKDISCDVSAVCYGGCVEGDRFVMPLPIGERAVVFGGGHVAQALVPLLAGVGFRCTVFENRPEFALRSRFPAAEQIVLGDYRAIGDSVELEESDFLIVMTHGHVHDFEIQEQLLRKRYAYVGVMGSRKKIAAVNARLVEAGIPREALERVHTPIGLNIGAVTPEEIAVSVAAECIAVRAQLRGIKKGTGCPGHM